MSLTSKDLREGPERPALLVVSASADRARERAQHNEYMKAYTKRRRREDPEFDRRVRETNLRSYHKHSAERASRHQRRKAAGLCTACGKRPAVPGILKCDICRERMKKTNQRIQQAVLDHYGRTCECCGESEPMFLTLDHINGGGAADRRKHGGNYKFYIYKEAKRTGIWPADLQTLCFNCNSGRERNGGVCPHKTKVTETAAA